VDREQVLAARGKQKMGVPNKGEQTPEVLGNKNPKTPMPQTECEPVPRQEILPGEEGTL